VITAIFNTNGSLLLVPSKSPTIKVVDLPSHEPPPAWLADLAEFAATQTRYDQSRSPDLAKIKVLRARLLASTAKGPWDVFGRWYFAESSLRSISPWSTLSLQEYVESLIALGDKDSLDYASSLAQDHPAWMMKIVRLRMKEQHTNK
jgi:hypothetical protein